MKLPSSLQSFQKEAEKIIKNQGILDVEFSGPTYQVQVKDSSSAKPIWAFLQLDNKGILRDAFCSHELHEDMSACEHVAAAYLYVIGSLYTPLHKRFARSFWNQVGWLLSQKWGYVPEKLKEPHENTYTMSSHGKEKLEVKGLNLSGKTHLKEIFVNRRPETEETSLKFSNLSPEEIALWHQGRPSAMLQYELSLWCDLAKWLMLMDERGEKYKISYEYSSNQVPQSIEIVFPGVRVYLTLKEDELPVLIPTLAQVSSPLKVFGLQGEGIGSITYDEKAKTLSIHSKKKRSHGQIPPVLSHPKGGIPLGDWLYVPKEGFYLKDAHHLLLHPVLQKKEIPQALDEYSLVMRSLMKDVEIYEEPVSLSYHMEFDEDWNLLVRAYLFVPGDLSKTYSQLYGDWAYLEGKGFYKLEDIIFDEVEMLISRKDVSDFISRHRAWLNTQEGFRPQLSSIESQLTYSVDDVGNLFFESRIPGAEEDQEIVDFEHWIYIKGRGFYQKSHSHIGLALRPGIPIRPQEISSFIRANRAELAHIPGFFSSRGPISQAGLHISMDKEGTIFIRPEYVFFPEYRGVAIRFFGDYVYTMGEGFHEIPLDSHIPERFRDPVQIPEVQQQIFVEFELEQLRPYAIYLDKQLQKPQELHLVAQSLEHASSEESPGQMLAKLWFQSEKGHVDALVLWKALHAKERFVLSDAGLIDLQHERFTWLRWLRSEKMDKRHRLMKLSSLDLLRLNAFEMVMPPTQKTEEAKATREHLEALMDFKVPQEPDFTGLRSDLRPYQLAGVRWLWFLYHQHLSGLLCDDMGLGKTHQGMALIQAIKNFKEKEITPVPKKRPLFLIICPTSVLYHWQDKLHAFLPSMRVYTFYGSNRNLKEIEQNADILLTSYGIWRREKDRLRELAFEAVIFDEIQLAKNAGSLLYKALEGVKAHIRIGMTGTPIENRLRELKALFDLTLPTYMPPETEYRDYFVKPIEKDCNIKRRELLSRFIRPFMMRRRKKEVLTDLPEKMEEVAYCPLLPQQQELYQRVLAGGKSSLEQQLQNDKSPIPYLHVFALLTRLKRICDHPAVFWGDVENYKSYSSGKWDLFVELLNEARDSGQKVVVYSQYLAQLDIFENYLTEHHIGYASIRGATVKRGEEVKRFHEDPACEVFVASLQAAGLGIDLTAASVVIHYDRWWNAARENQATDRVHRIGQTRGVQVFKLVTRGTFEEKIDAMITRKGQLMEDVVGADDQEVLKHFDRQDLLDLLRDLELKPDDQKEVIQDVEEVE